jgi:hypothetical protein
VKPVKAGRSEGPKNQETDQLEELWKSGEKVSRNSLCHDFPWHFIQPFCTLFHLVWALLPIARFLQADPLLNSPLADLSR